MFIWNHNCLPKKKASKIFGIIYTSQDLFSLCDGIDFELVYCLFCSKFFFLFCSLQGSPEFLSNDNCSTVFEWESSVVCKHLSKPVKEVPCYVYVQGKKRDLTPLIKVMGAYKLTSPSNVDVYINLCRDINSGEFVMIHTCIHTYTHI